MKEKPTMRDYKGLLQRDELYKYVMDTNVYPREMQVLKELREHTHSTNPRALMGTPPDEGQFLSLFLNLISPKRTIEIGVFTGYSLLLTALSIPEDAKITAIDISRESYEVGLPFIRKAGVEHKIDFVESEGLPALDSLLKNEENEGSFEFAFVDADKVNYWEYHGRLMKLVRVGGVVAYDNTLWCGTVAMSDEETPEMLKGVRLTMMEFNKLLAADARVQISQIPLGDGITLCRRIA